MRFVLNLVFIVCCAIAKAQNFRPIQVNYQYAIGANVSKTDGANLDNVERSEQSILEVILKYPILLKQKKITIIPELTHKVIGQDFTDWNATLGVPKNGNLTRLAINGIFSINERWSFLAAFTASQGVNSGIGWDLTNNFYRFGLGFLINTKAGNRIGGAIRYVEELNLPVPLILFYGTSANRKWYYNISFPAQSIIEYSISERWRLRFIERADNDRFILKGSIASDYNQATLNLSLGGSYSITKSLFLGLQAGLTPINILTFYSNRTQELDTIDLTVQPTIGVSLYFNVDERDKAKELSPNK